MATASNPLLALQQGTRAGAQLAGLSSFAQAGVSAGVAGGAALAGIGGASIATAGLAAIPAALMEAVDIFKCGTFGSIGCDKRSDTVVDQQLQAAARSILWMVESGQATAAQGKAALAQLLAKAKPAFNDIQRSYYSPFEPVNYNCGSWLDSTSGNAVNPGLSIPLTSVAATLDCMEAGAGKTPQQMYEVDFPAAMDKLAGATAAAQPVAPAGVGGIVPMPVSVGRVMAPAAPVLTASGAGLGGGMMLGIAALAVIGVALVVH